MLKNTKFDTVICVKHIHTYKRLLFSVVLLRGLPSIVAFRKNANQLKKFARNCLKCMKTGPMYAKSPVSQIKHYNTVFVSRFINCPMYAKSHQKHTHTHTHTHTYLSGRQTESWKFQIICVLFCFFLHQFCIKRKKNPPIKKQLSLLLVVFYRSLF